LLRNRIADHEPVHTWDLTGDYTRIRDTTERINPRLAWWIDTSNRVPSFLDSRPVTGSTWQQPPNTLRAPDLLAALSSGWSVGESVEGAAECPDAVDPGDGALVGGLLGGGEEDVVGGRFQPAVEQLGVRSTPPAGDRATSAAPGPSVAGRRASSPHRARGVTGPDGSRVPRARVHRGDPLASIAMLRRQVIDAGLMRRRHGF